METADGIECGPCPDGYTGDGFSCDDVDEVGGWACVCGMWGKQGRRKMAGWNDRFNETGNSVPEVDERMEKKRMENQKDHIGRNAVSFLAARVEPRGKPSERGEIGRASCRERVSSPV